MEEYYRVLMHNPAIRALSDAVGAAKERLDREDPDEERDEYWTLDEPEVVNALEKIDMEQATFAAFDVFQSEFGISVAEEMHDSSPFIDGPDRFVKMMCLYAVVYMREKMA